MLFYGLSTIVVYYSLNQIITCIKLLYYIFK
jgi:hypothetical protein